MRRAVFPLPALFTRSCIDAHASLFRAKINSDFNDFVARVALEVGPR